VFNTLHGLSTTVGDHAERARDLGAEYRTERRPITTLSCLLEAHGVEKIDFLKVDVEGAELDVFAGTDLDRWRPRIIVAEVVAPFAKPGDWHECDTLLSKYDYRAGLFDGLNRFYIASEEAELASNLPQHPAPWNVVPHLYEFGRAHENPDHPDHALATSLLAAFLADLPLLTDERLASLLLADANRSSNTSGLRQLWPANQFGVSDRVPGTQESLYRALVGTDAFRAALGRIAAPFDGGFIHEPEPKKPA
jgi:hypothetical protein